MTLKPEESYNQCLLCRGELQDSRMLDCLHSFCLECLKSYINSSTTKSLSCPICLTPLEEINSENVSNLKTDLFLQNMTRVSSNENENQNENAEEKEKEILVCEDGENEATSYCIECEEYFCLTCTKAHHRMKATKNHKLIPIDELKIEDQQNGTSKLLNNVIYCLIHSEEMKLFCENCDTLICFSCIDQHPSHQIFSLTNCIENQKKILNNSLNLAKEKQKEFEDGIIHCSQVIDEIEINSTRTNQEISQIFENIRTKLNEKEKELLEKLEKVRKFKVNQLLQQKNELEIVINNIEQSCDTIESSISQPNRDMELLSMKSHYIKRLNNLINSHVKTSPTQTSCVEFSSSKETENSINSMISHLGVINIGEVAAENSLILRNEKSIFEHEEYEFEILSYSREGFKIHVGGNATKFQIDIEGESKNQKLQYEIQDLHNGNYLVKIKAKEKATLSISIKVDDIHLQNSPFNIEVLQKPKSRDYAQITKSQYHFGLNGNQEGQFHFPYCICLNSKGYIIVSDYGNHRVQIFDAQGNFISKFGMNGYGNGQFYGPWGVAVNSKENILVCDKNNHRIQIFDSNGKFISKFGSKGRGDGQFDRPEGITVDLSDNILVSDYGNHRVQIFDSKGKFLLKFGGKGNEDGCFSGPCGMVVNSKGNILVCDSENNRIQMFDSKGKFLSKIEAKGIEDGQFDYPFGITVDLNDNICVSDRHNHRIQVFEPNGKFIAKIGVNEVRYPSGIIIDQMNNIIVSEYGNHRISIF